MESVKTFFSDRKNVIITVVIVIVVISLIVVIVRCRRPQPMIQQFKSVSAESEMPMKEMQDKNMPYVDAKTGSLLDGPGFERGDIQGASQEMIQNIPSNYYFLDDGAGGEMSVQHNLCSKSCCSEQWPTPFKQKNDPFVCANKGMFTPSKMFCSNTFQDAGCLCLTKSQNAFINNRGGNGREWF